jgi:hypothetical protein
MKIVKKGIDIRRWFGTFMKFYSFFFGPMVFHSPSVNFWSFMEFESLILLFVSKKIYFL